VGGWWYYYLYALVVKVPLGTWLLILLAVFVKVRRISVVADWRDELVVLAPIGAVLLLVILGAVPNETFPLASPRNRTKEVALLGHSPRRDSRWLGFTFN
jgi:hypothetical protein